MKFLLIIFSLSMAHAQDCNELYLQHLESDMALTYQAFDQTMASGFRPLAKDCPSEAVDLIKNYIIFNQAKENSLRWHIAQLLGETQSYAEAELYALSTLKEIEKHGFKWNDYVMGYIAYWRGDIEKVKQKIAVLESHSENNGNLINAKLLKTFYLELHAKQQQQQ